MRARVVRPRLVRLLIVVGLGLAALVPVPAAAAMTGKAVAAMVAKEFSVRVLRVIPLKADGRAAFRVTFMTPGGNVNGAFAVASVIVDGETGRLVSQFRHRASGYQLPGAPRYRTDPRRPDAAERGVVWR